MPGMQYRHWRQRSYAHCDCRSHRSPYRQAPHQGRKKKTKMSMASMGETCEELGYHFHWPAWRDKPNLWKDCAADEPPLTIINRVPFLMVAANRNMKNGIARSAPDFSEPGTGEFFDGVDGIYSASKSSTLKNLIVALVIVPPSPPLIQC